MALLNNVFGGTSDNMLRDIRSVLQEYNADSNFPIDAINRKIAEAKRKAYFDTYALDDFFKITYGKRLSFLALSLLYDVNNWNGCAGDSHY